MKNFKFVAIAAMAAFALSANAQFANGGKSNSAKSSSASGLVKDCANYNRFSFGYTPVTFTYDSSHYDPADLQGFSLGWTGGWNVAGHNLPVFVEAGAHLMVNTGKDLGDRMYDSDYSEDDYFYERTTAVSMLVPVNATYKLTFGHAGGFYLAPYAGIHFKLNVLGTAKLHVDRDAIEDDLGYSIDDSDLESFYGKDWDEAQSYFDKKVYGKDGQWKRFQMGYQVGLNLGYNAFNFGLGYSAEFTKICKKTSTGGLVLSLGYNF